MLKAIILRGVSGSGKSTMAKELERSGWQVVSADDYFVNPLTGEYTFDRTQLHKAHTECFELFTQAVGKGQNVVVDNTNTTEKEVGKYISYLEKHAVSFVTLVVENRHGNDSVHNVPLDVRETQAKRLQQSIKLI